MWSYSDPRFALPREPPFPAGMSPFHTLGVAYAGLIAFIGKQVPGGIDAFHRALPSEALRRYFDQPFSSSRNYDVVPLPYAAATIARLRGVGFVEQVRDANRTAARAGFAKVYSALIRTIQSDTLVLALPRAAAILHDFGKVTAKVIGPRCVQGARNGVPHVLVAWSAIGSGGFIETMMQDGGAKEVRMTFLDPEEDGLVAGQTTYRLPFRLEWL